MFQGGGNTHIAKFNMDTAGTATDFGDTLSSVNIPCAVCNATRLVQAGGDSDSNEIAYWTVSSGGAGQDFGDTATMESQHMGCSSSTRAIFGAGYDVPAKTSAVERNLKRIRMAKKLLFKI